MVSTSPYNRTIINKTMKKRKILLLLFIIRFRQCQGNYRSSVAYRDNYPFINKISFIIDNNNK